MGRKEGSTRLYAACSMRCGVDRFHFTTLHGLSSYHDNNIVALVFVLVLLPQDLVNLCAHMVHRAHKYTPGPALASHPSLNPPQIP